MPPLSVERLKAFVEAFEKDTEIEEEEYETWFDDLLQVSF